MFIMKRRCFDFLTHFCQYQVCLNARKPIYESFSANETSSAKSKKQVALTSDYICLPRRKRVSFLSILLSLKKIGRGVKFQDVPTIRATFTVIVSNNVAKSLKVYVFDRPEIAECSGAKY